MLLIHPGRVSRPKLLSPLHANKSGSWLTACRARRIRSVRLRRRGILAGAAAESSSCHLDQLAACKVRIHIVRLWELQIYEAGPVHSYKSRDTKEGSLSRSTRARSKASSAPCLSFLHVGHTTGRSHSLSLRGIDAGAAAESCSCCHVEQMAACRSHNIFPSAK